MMNDYPEHDKMRLIADESQAQGEFVEWLAAEKGVYLGGDVKEYLAEYHNIDLDKIEAEKRAMLAKIRGEGE